MSRIPTLKTSMTPFPYAVHPDAPLTEAAAMMEEHGVRHLPVTENHVPVGVVSDRDLRAAADIHAARGGDVPRVRDACAPDPYVVDLEYPLTDVLITMAERHIGSVIVTRHGELAGVFTSVDACRVFGEYLRERFPPPGGDEAA